MPDYESNPLIQAIDAKRRAAEEAAAAEPKVISIITGKPYEGKPKRVRRPKKPPVDLAAVEVLESAIAELKAGEMFGAILLARRPHGGFAIKVALPMLEDAQIAASNLVAGTEILKQTLLDIATFGPEAAQEMADELNGEDE